MESHLAIDEDYLLEVLLRLLQIHSPTGYTDPVVREVCHELDELGIHYELTIRGAIRATLPGRAYSPDRAVVTHVDTLGAMVKGLKPNGRLALTPVGTWSARFAAGARVSVFTDDSIYRGTILPLKASGHIFDNEVDTQVTDWDHVELRVDERIESERDLERLGINIGDFVGIDARAEVSPSGYVNARHLDNKAGVAAVLAAAKHIIDQQITLPCDCHLLFTISEEVGSGASAVLHGDIGEMVTIDNGTVGPGQNSFEHGVTVAMADSSGPCDYHLTHHLLFICKQFGLPYRRDIFKYYRCDSASAVEAGNDLRTALLTFGIDASHGYERTHRSALEAVARFVVCYAQSALLQKTGKPMIEALEDFPQTRKVRIDADPRRQRTSIAQVPIEGDVDDVQHPEAGDGHYTPEPASRDEPRQD
ncbi:MAG: osmoprotectant NAGGN system M42 family peptidase [Opitutales bacterium]